MCARHGCGFALRASSVRAGALITGCVGWGNSSYRPSIPEYAKLPFVEQERKQFVVAGDRYAPRFVTLSGRLGTP